jgi:acyl carrier protein phosphodiesterase
MPRSEFLRDAGGLESRLMELFPKEFDPKIKRKIIKRWTKESFKAFNSIFSSEKDFNLYLNNIKDPKDAMLFLRIGCFYRVAKKYWHESYVELIMIISIIEKIMNKEKEFQEFHEWIEGQDDKINELLSRSEPITESTRFKKIIRELKNEYFGEFGSSRNVSNFFKTYLTQEGKIKLIRSLKVRRKTVKEYSERRSKTLKEVTSIEELKKEGLEVNEKFVSYCYDWRNCWFKGEECDPNLGCLIMDSKSYCGKALEKVVKSLYQMRSDFVHSAIIPLLSKKNYVSTLVSINGKPVLIKLTAEDLENIFESALKSYFDKIS